MGSKREIELKNWLKNHNYDLSSFVDLSGDASFRKYYRIMKDGTSYAVMDCPPDKEALSPFILISHKLHKAKVNVPKIYECDEKNGFLVLTDLGDNLYSKKLNEETVYCLYTDALETIVKMQKNVDCSNLKSFDNFYNEENNLFIDWFLRQHLSVDMTENLQLNLQEEFEKVNIILKNIPQSFVHRDYHSRNLLITELNNPGVIDYQDAVIGPITYDLVSLLKDCYVTWDDGLVEDMLESFFNRIKTNALKNISDFRYWFDITGLQRHIKAIGIFSRLKYRDNKENYINDIPRTYAYIEKVLKKYKELAPLEEIFSTLEIRKKISI